jgi:tRNA wybutosine-synthesizing protein 2
MGYLRKALANSLSEEGLGLLPRGFERIGHVAIISLPEELLPKTRVIAAELLKIKGIETVARKVAPIEGRERRPRIEVVAGKTSTETIHKEGGCLFKLDISEVMFSAGNLYERQRLPKLVAPGETVVDLFAGVGQFSIPIAKHGKPHRVYAIELNPVACRYLAENVRMNRVGHIVVPIQGDCLKVAPRGLADRVLMGILHVGHRYLPLALQVLKPEGGVIHYHESVPCRLSFERPISRIVRAAGGRRVKILAKRTVKRYAPGVNHVVIDARVGLT